jgi:hypothetical protein
MNRRNLWPSHPDRFEVPPGCGDGNATDTAKELYRQHCFPSDDEVRATIRYARAQYMAAHPMRALDVLYILTNADADWVRTFTSSLRGDGWGTVVGTPDLALDEEMMEVSFAVDMEIARRSEVFIGNGVSVSSHKFQVQHASSRLSTVVIIHEQHHAWSSGRWPSSTSKPVLVKKDTRGVLSRTLHGLHTYWFRHNREFNIT